ncbi:MAG: dihydroorotate oxidase [Chloroflexota bacterium]|nr:dihydroorotate oxidase [Chloroflexota bacterium]
MNASGALCMTQEELLALGESQAGAIVTKSMTREPREGNPEPRYYQFASGSINSMGLPNLGRRAYGQLIPRLSTFGKPVIASIAGFSVEEYVEVAEHISATGPDLVEVNLSCPNVAGKPQIAYDFEASASILKAVRRVVKQPMGVKIPPYLDLVLHEAMAKVLKENGADFLVAINSIGNALVIDPDREEAVIRPKGGLGGLGGACIKPVALANVRVFHQLMGPDFPIIGVGGIESGTNIFEHLLAGAGAVQVGTAFVREGIGVFPRLAGELGRFLGAKGYGSAFQVVGRLKVL